MQQHFLLALRQSNVPLWLTVRPNNQPINSFLPQVGIGCSGDSYFVPDTGPNGHAMADTTTVHHNFRLLASPAQIATVNAWRQHSGHPSLHLLPRRVDPCCVSVWLSVQLPVQLSQAINGE